MHSNIKTATRGRVLAVDDSEVMRELLTGYLEAGGFSVAAVDSGFAALEAARDQCFDAVILGVDMPGMDGLEVGRRLRSNPSTSAFAIAMHTSIDEKVVRHGFDQYDDFLPKPCSAELLGERVDAMIRATRLKGVGPADLAL